jgi:hypothetical protein
LHHLLQAAPIAAARPFNMLMERNPIYTPLAAPSTWEFHAQWKVAEGAEIYSMNTRCPNRVIMNLLGCPWTTLYLASLGHIFFRDFFVHSPNLANCKLTKKYVFSLISYLPNFLQFFFFPQYHQISLLGF